jgi:hypothetical protein
MNYIKFVPGLVFHPIFSNALYYIMNTAKTTAGINHVSPPLLTCEPAAVTTAEGVVVDVPEPTTAGAVVEVPEPEDAETAAVDVSELTIAVVVVSDTLVDVAEPDTADDGS